MSNSMAGAAIGIRPVAPVASNRARRELRLTIEDEMLFSGKRPSNIGVKNNNLTPCPSTPNCVCSQHARGENSIEPIAAGGDFPTVWAKLAQHLKSLERVDIIEESARYIYAEFRTKGLGFVDDVEFLGMPEEGVIHVRSASRLGKYDFGANRKRIEAIREAVSR